MTLQRPRTPTECPAYLVASAAKYTPKNNSPEARSETDQSGKSFLGRF